METRYSSFAVVETRHSAAYPAGKPFVLAVYPARRDAERYVREMCIPDRGWADSAEWGGCFERRVGSDINRGFIQEVESKPDPECAIRVEGGVVTEVQLHPALRALARQLGLDSASVFDLDGLETRETNDRAYRKLVDDKWR